MAFSSFLFCVVPEQLFLPQTRAASHVRQANIQTLWDRLVLIPVMQGTLGTRQPEPALFAPQASFLPHRVLALARLVQRENIVLLVHLYSALTAILVSIPQSDLLFAIHVLPDRLRIPPDVKVAHPAPLDILLQLWGRRPLVYVNHVKLVNMRLL